MSIERNRWDWKGQEHNWIMPKVKFWKRWPGVRHIRALYHSLRLTLWADYWLRSGYYVPGGYDDWVIYGMWRGWERS